ncbi:unnamed protein product [marine sediment metagenome]|uniref:Uncharacterized protein n=1 Tax=marine sediment metagenome TaxID=412755 RepID=X1UVA1_9ZZZZ
MAIENWVTGTEMRAIAMIVKQMDERKMSLGKLGGDVLRIPMSKLKKAGYSFRGCDITGDYRTLPQLRNSFQKIDMGAEDTEESIGSLAEALAKVMAEIEGAKEAKKSKPTTLRELGY